MPLNRLSPAAITAELDTAAERFGQFLRRWRVAQGWSQNTPQDWGQAVGVLYVFNSQWSMLESAKLRGPKPTVFRALGVMNSMLHARQYGAIRDRALLERVRQAEPICHADGEPWDGPDFYAAFTGELDFPPIRKRLQAISDLDARSISASLREAVQTNARAKGLSLRAGVEQFLTHVPTEHRPRLDDVLLGDAWTGAELMELRDEDGKLQPHAWLAEWMGGYADPA